MPDFCCLIGLCCPPAERRAQIAAWLASMMGGSSDSALTHADAMIARIDADPFVTQMQMMFRKTHGV